MNPSASAIPFPPRAPCLFLDFDGTLVDFAATPTQVAPDPALTQLLMQLSACLGGALAIVSGRPLPEIDGMLAPLRLPAAGLHGLQWRRSGHINIETPCAAAWLREQQPALARHVAAHPGLLLEDKGASLAVHFRRAPQHEASTRQTLLRLCAALPAEAMLLEGDCVLELRPRHPDKGDAVEAFMRETPFVSRFPVYIGDDSTDAPGLAAVTRLGGTAIAVGQRVPAPASLATPTAVRAWLTGLLQHLAPA